jgi:hypothetical protein
MAWTFQTLTQAIQDWMEDDNAELVARLPEIVNLGQIKLARDLRLAALEHTETVAFAAGDPTIG